jgi:chromosome segregation ATPase
MGTVITIPEPKKMVTRERATEVETKLREMALNGDSDEFGLIKRWTEICDRAKEQEPVRQQLAQIVKGLVQINKAYQKFNSAYEKLNSRQEKLDEAYEQLESKREQLQSKSERLKKEHEALPTTEGLLEPIYELVADFERHYETK